MKLKLQGIRGIKRISKVDLKMEVFMGRAPSPKSMLVEVTNVITRVFLIPPLVRTFLLVVIME